MIIVSSHPSFNDTSDSLKHEFNADMSNTVIVLGGHDFASRGETITSFKKRYNNAKIIVFNQEPLLATQRQFMNKQYFKLLKEADEVWDYDELNLKLIKTIRPDAKLHILKPYKVWPKEHDKDIDILFYGALNEHRITLLNALKKKYKVVILTNCYDLDSYILRSKILLNVHYYYECAMQEQARMIRWIGAPCRIISEKSVKNYLGVEEKTYVELFSL